MRFDSRVGVLFARAARGKEGRSGGKAAALRGGVLAKQQVDAQQAGNPQGRDGLPVKLWKQRAQRLA